MASAISEQHPEWIKILIAGGFGAGKTTFVGTASEIRPLVTEEVLTEASIGTDYLTGIKSKTTTTVAVDFGRLTLPVPPHGLVMYLFGMPGNQRFWAQWHELSAGVVGAVVLADTRRLGDCFESVAFFEDRGTPFLVAVNQFPDAHNYSVAEVRDALTLPGFVPIMLCDARHWRSAREVLIGLLEYVLSSSPHQYQLV